MFTNAVAKLYIAQRKLDLHIPEQIHSYSSHSQMFMQEEAR